jgi:hypothetical protein
MYVVMLFRWEKVVCTRLVSIIFLFYGGASIAVCTTQRAFHTRQNSQNVSGLLGAIDISGVHLHCVSFCSY